GALRAPDDATGACPAALAAVGPASERRHRARPAGRALCVLGWVRGAPPPRCVVHCGSSGAGPRAQRSVTQPLGLLSLQRPHGAAPGAHARVPAAAALWNARVGGPAGAAAPLGVPVRALGHASSHRRRAVLRADHAVALPAILRGRARAPSAPHRATPHLHRHGGDNVVAGALACAETAASELPCPARVSLPARASHVPRRRDDHAFGGRAVSILHEGAAGVGSHAAGRSAAWRPVDVGSGDDLPVGGDERGLVPVECAGGIRRCGAGGAPGSVRERGSANAECGTLSWPLLFRVPPSAFPLSTLPPPSPPTDAA